MGEVYRGENVFTGDPVAIKVVLPELAADEKADLMFMREARTLSQLSDDAIVRYYNFVKDPDIDRYCLVMEFIKGVPLSDHTAQSGPISTDEAWILLKRLAKGLETAHGREVIHRDLSPDNVMLPDGIISEARLIDFGIAKSNVVKEGTMAGQFAGKFKYVSPEQLGHYGGIVGPASDIYGLALLLSAALLAKPLDMGSSIVEAVQARQSIPDLSDLPAEFRAILAYMLEPDPADRPENMAMIGHLVDVPSDIPHKYAAGLPLPAPRQTTQTGVRTLGGTTSTMAPRAAHEVSGLQAPPTAALEQARGKTSGVSADIPQNRPRGGGRAIGVLLAAFVTAITAVLYYAWDRGLIDQFIAGNSDPMGDVPETSPGLPPIQPNTRDGFLATLNTGACTFAARISEGPNLGLIEGFAGTSGAFADLPGAYEEKFGARPDTLERVVAPEQCAALSFAKALQGRGVTPISIQLAANEVTSGKSISGEITDPLGRNVWLVLVSGRGSVYNLTTRLSELVGDRRTFRFGLSLAEGAEATPQILLAVATTSPLATAANARDASPANELLPIILEEISKSDLKGAAGLAHILLVPG